MKQTPYMIEIHYVNNVIDKWFYDSESCLEQAYKQLKGFLIGKKRYKNMYVEFYQIGKLVNLDNVIFIEKKIITP